MKITCKGGFTSDFKDRSLLESVLESVGQSVDRGRVYSDGFYFISLELLHL